MLAAVTSGLSTVITWVGTVISALTTDAGALNDLLPLLAIGVAISALIMLYFVSFYRNMEVSYCSGTAA